MNLTNWFKKRILRKNPQQLKAKTLYIFPSLYGFFYCLSVFSILLGAINYQVSAAFLFAFLLIIIGLLSMVQAHNNLKGISIEFISVENTEAGKPVKIHLLLKSSITAKYSLLLRAINHPTSVIEKLEPQETQISLLLSTHQRGVYSLPLIQIKSYFPFGLFQVWGYAYFKKPYYVSPKPLATINWPNPNTQTSLLNKKLKLVNDGDELYQLKSTEQPWAQPSHIAWKKVALGQGWWLKDLKSMQQQSYLFSLKAFNDFDLEDKLSILSYLVQTAEKQQHYYGLDLYGKRTQISQGRVHLNHCLKELAIFK